MNLQLNAEIGDKKGGKREYCSQFPGEMASLQHEWASVSWGAGVPLRLSFGSLSYCVGPSHKGQLDSHLLLSWGAVGGFAPSRELSLGKGSDGIWGLRHICCSLWSAG